MLTIIRWLGTAILLLILIPIIPLLYKTLEDALKTAKILQYGNMESRTNSISNNNSDHNNMDTNSSTME